jgi:hypothetical protein
MKQIHPDVSLIPLMRRVVADDVRVKLYTNDFTPDRDSVLADFTEKDVANGYAAIDVPAADFVLDGVVAHKGVLMALPITFTPTNDGGVNIYGYFVTSLDDADLLACARFDAPTDWDVPNTVEMWPVFGDESQFAS